jgi:hypothetical protein
MGFWKSVLKIGQNIAAIALESTAKASKDGKPITMGNVGREALETAAERKRKADDAAYAESIRRSL